MFNKLNSPAFIALLVVAFSGITTNRVSAQEIRASNPIEKKVLLLVAALPEVQERAQQIKALSHGKCRSR